MVNLKILGILVQYVTATFFQLLIDFVITQGRETFTCQSKKQDASLTLGKPLEKAEKKQKMKCC